MGSGCLFWLLVSVVSSVTLTVLVNLELARIGSQLFVYDSATRDQTATPPLLDTFATRLSAQPLSLVRRVRVDRRVAN
jgi:hypothetical protein